MASAAARDYRGSGDWPPVGYRGKAPGQGVRGRSPLQLTTFVFRKIILS